MEEKVILVDENDQETGTIEKIEAHRKALLHRAVSVFIFNSKNQLLLQKRANHKYHSPGLWTNTACTHPFPGEDTVAAAQRRLMQEMGLDASLKKVFDFIYKAALDNELTEHEFDHVFIGVSDNMPKPNPDEVMDYKLIDPEVLLQDIRKNPHLYTYWFKMIVERVLCKNAIIENC